jgi:hypothetical protein
MRYGSAPVLQFLRIGKSFEGEKCEKRRKEKEVSQGKRGGRLKKRYIRKQKEKKVKWFAHVGKVLAKKRK